MPNPSSRNAKPATASRRATITALPLPALDTPRIGHDVPVRVARRAGAELVTKHFFPVSHRTLEAWPLVWRRVNGRALCETADLFVLARAKLDEAPPTMGKRGAQA